MRRSVLTDDAGAIERERDRYVHQANVVHDLVIGALQECGIDGGNGPHPFAGKPDGEIHRVLLRNPDIEKAVGELFGKLVQTGALRHRRRDGYNTRVSFCQVAHRLAEDGRIARGLGRRFVERPRRDVKLGHAVILHGQLFCMAVAFALLCHHVQQNRTRLVFHLGERVKYFLEIMAVNRPYVIEPELLKHHSGNKQALSGLHQVLRKPQQPRPEAGDGENHLLYF